MVDLKRWLESGQPVTWLFAGDSITQGAVHTRGWRDYTQLFKERLSELGRNEDVVINTAVGGWDSSRLVERLDDRVLRHRTDVVFLMIGTNNASLQGLASFQEDYQRIIDQVQCAGAELIAQTPPPSYPVDASRMAEVFPFPSSWDANLRQHKIDGMASVQQYLGDCVRMTIEVCRQRNVSLVDHWAYWHRPGVLWGQLTDGGCHPNEYGHRVLAHHLFRQCGMWDPSGARAWTCRLLTPVQIETDED